jgi:ferrochelatase
MNGKIAILLMAYGTPSSASEIEPYYTHIRHGDPPSPELLTELTGRYDAIGGLSPLLEISRRQAAAIEKATGTRVVLGMKHAQPFLESALDDLVVAGVEEIIGVALAPHYSSLSVGEYEVRVRNHLENVSRPPRFRMVRNWHLASGYLSFLADAVGEALNCLSPDVIEKTHVLFTAHSLPEKILAEDDPYPEQLAETANAVGVLTGWPRWSTAWQSAGRTSAKWLGPDVLDATRALVEEGAAAIVICPCGFVTDHLEVLYDIDIEARSLADELGIELLRTRSPNDDAVFVEGLAAVISDEIKHQSGTHECGCDGNCKVAARIGSTIDS